MSEGDRIAEVSINLPWNNPRFRTAATVHRLIEAARMIAPDDPRYDQAQKILGIFKKGKQT